MTQSADIGFSQSCRICQARAHRIRLFARRENETLHLFKCPQCRCEFVFPAPSAEWLRIEYDGYYSKRTSHGTQGKKNYFQKLLADTRIEFANARIVDMGSAEGECVAAINARWPSATVTAVENNLQCMPYYRTLACTMVNEPIERWLEGTSEKNFDIVLGFDVIEHFTDISKTMESIVRVMKTDGVFIATFPNCESFSRKILKNDWFHYKVEHCTYFSSKSLEVFEKKYSLARRALKPLCKRLPIHYFLAIGKNFGPQRFRAFSTVLDALCPQFLRYKYVPLLLGEWLWIVQKK